VRRTNWKTGIILTSPQKGVKALEFGYTPTNEDRQDGSPNKKGQPLQNRAYNDRTSLSFSSNLHERNTGMMRNTICSTMLRRSIAVRTTNSIPENLQRYFTRNRTSVTTQLFSGFSFHQPSKKHRTFLPGKVYHRQNTYGSFLQLLQVSSIAFNTTSALAGFSTINTSSLSDLVVRKLFSDTQETGRTNGIEDIVFTTKGVQC
jgi:hypothetical protein